MRETKSTILKTTKVGAVSVQVERGTTRTRYRTVCRKAMVPKDQQRRDWQNLADAHAFASKLNQSILTGQIKDIDNDKIFELKKIAQKFETTKILEQDNPNWKGRGIKLDDAFDLGFGICQILNEVNLHSYSTTRALHDITTFFKDKAKHESAPSFKEIIEKCVADKIGSHGGTTGNKISGTQQQRWRKDLGVQACGWIGHFKTTDDPKKIFKACRDGIKRGVDTRPHRLGVPWDERTKYNRASLLSQFGIWASDEDYLTKNIFERLPKKFKVLGDSRHEIFEPEVVEKMFNLAANDPKHIDHIPYMTLCFFAGLRPSEVAYDGVKGKRRYNWKWAKNWQERRRSDVTGGMLIEMPHKDDNGFIVSKSKSPRDADLTPNGLAWLEWYFAQNGKELPNDGKVWHSKMKWEELKKAAGLWGHASDGKKLWPSDVTRNSFTSYANHHNGFNANRLNYWQDACGHTPRVFQQFYKRKVHHQDCVDYFNIYPPTKKGV